MQVFQLAALPGLNESPSEKEGKSVIQSGAIRNVVLASMKVPPKRKGNVRLAAHLIAVGLAASMKVPPKRKGNL